MSGEFASPADRKGKDAENGYNFRETKGLHVGTNYVANMQYIYNVAKRVEDGKSVADAIAATKYKGSLNGTENGFKELKEMDIILNVTKYMILPWSAVPIH